MENASKALLIAGAILLVILIISLGLMVFNQAKSSVGSANLNQQEIEAFNSKFTSYEADSVSGSQVNALIQTVISSNQAEKIAGTYKYISVAVGTTDIVEVDSATQTYTVSTPARVTTGNSYKVVCSYTDGVITSIDITQLSGLVVPPAPPAGP